MKFLFCDKLYSDGFSEKKLRSVRDKILNGKLKMGVFLITLPLVDDGILEIYWYPEFLQPAYKNTDREVTVVGIARSREDAFSLVERIVKDVGLNEGKLPIMEYFEG